MWQYDLSELKRLRKQEETFSWILNWDHNYSHQCGRPAPHSGQAFNQKAIKRSVTYSRTSITTHRKLNERHRPMTLLANDVRMRVARPRSPIFTDPVGPVMKILSHLRSRCTMGGVRVCRNCRPFRICLHQLRRTLGFITLKRLRYLKQRKAVTSFSRCFHSYLMMIY